ncbi:hypothetical protein ACA910_004797 [Epithemia clementina (nom. ined.)]
MNPISSAVGNHNCSQNSNKNVVILLLQLPSSSDCTSKDTTRFSAALSSLLQSLRTLSHANNHDGLAQFFLQTITVPRHHSKKNSSGSHVPKPSFRPTTTSLRSTYPTVTLWNDLNAATAENEVEMTLSSGDGGGRDNTFSLDTNSSAIAKTIRMPPKTSPTTFSDQPTRRSACNHCLDSNKTTASMFLEDDSERDGYTKVPTSKEPPSRQPGWCGPRDPDQVIRGILMPTKNRRNNNNNNTNRSNESEVSPSSKQNNHHKKSIQMEDHMISAPCMRVNANKENSSESIRSNSKSVTDDENTTTNNNNNNKIVHPNSDDTDDTELAQLPVFWRRRDNNI